MEQPDSDTLAWFAPGQHGTPAQALARIRAICAHVPELQGAMFAVLGAHQGVPREMLAAAIQQCRADAAAMPRADVVALLTATWTGGREGFDAVLRSRRKGERKGGLGWVKE
jgi:hypothetical protein